MAVSPEFMRRLPNILTVGRLVAVPVIVLLLLDPSRLMVCAAMGVFIVAALTDLLDGAIARRYGAVSSFGKLLDPLADKLLVMAALIMLVAQRSDVSGEPWVPGWLVVAVLAREIWVTGLRGIAADAGIVVAASTTGKIKTVGQMIAIGFLLGHDIQLPIGDVLIPAETIGLNLLVASLVISYWGAVEYTMQVLGEQKS